MNCNLRIGLGAGIASWLLASISAVSSGAPYINEIYFDPPGSSDYPHEYIELRGTPNQSLANYYLIFLENEDKYDHSAPDTGQVEMMFDFNHAQSGGVASLGSNGFLTLRGKGSPYSVAPGTTDLVNTGSGNGFGSGTDSVAGHTSTIGASNLSLLTSNYGKIENSGFTAMLIRNDSGLAPTLGLMLDGTVDNDSDPTTHHDGLDYATGQPGWTIVDSIGIYSDKASLPDAPGEAVFGRAYAPISFGPDVEGTEVTYLDDSAEEHTTIFHPNLSPGQTYIGLGYETEYIGRWGNSTGDTAGDWHVANLTDNADSGYSNPANGFRQSGHYHDPPLHQDDFVETNQYVPYGANLNGSLGAANYPTNLAQLPWDYNHNGIVDAGDYVIWRKTFGSTTDLSADGNGGHRIEEDDFTFWRARFGYAVGGPGAGTVVSVAVPEPACLMLTMTGLAIAALRRRRS